MSSKLNHKETLNNSHKGGKTIPRILQNRPRNAFRQCTLILQKNKGVLIGVVLCLLGCLYYLSRFLMDGIPHYLNEDTYMHLNRMVGLRNVWESPVSFLNFAHNGPAVNIFYPWLPMYPMYVFSRVTGSYVTAYKLYYLMLTLVTLHLGYFALKKISGSPCSALLFSVMYTFSAYRFTNVFRRAHLGESICMTVMPLVLLGLYNIAFGNKKRWTPLAIGMAVIAYSHNIFLLIASLTIALFTLISLRFWTERKERFLSLCKAAAAAIVFSLGSFVPMVQYMISNRLYTPGGSGQGLEDSAFGLIEIIEKSFRNEPVSYAVGFLVLAALLWLILFYFSRIFRKPGFEKVRAADCFAFTGTLIFFAATSLLPWKLIGDHTPLYFIQFVWRLNAQSTIYILSAFCLFFPRTLRSSWEKGAFTCLIIITACVLHVSALMTLHKEENTRIFEKDIASGDAITFDYAPVEAKEYRSIHGYTLDDVYVNGDPYPAEISFSEDGTVYTAFIEAPDSETEKLTADLPVFRYNTQICLVNGVKTETLLSERGTTLVEVLPGEKNEISIFYKHTTLTYGSWLFSLCAFLLICPMWKKMKISLLPISHTA